MIQLQKFICLKNSGKILTISFLIANELTVLFLKNWCLKNNKTLQKQTTKVGVSSNLIY